MTKSCSKCKVEKPYSEFGVHPNTRLRLRSACKGCELTYRSQPEVKARIKLAAARIYRNPGGKEKALARSRKFRKTEKGKLTNLKSVLSRYGLTFETYTAILRLQGECCAICKLHMSQMDRRICVDHDHETGAVRALLCNNCNAGIGYFRENVGYLEIAITYLKKHKPSNLVCISGEKK